MTTSVIDEDLLVKSTNKLSVDNDQSARPTVIDAGVLFSDDLSPSPAAPVVPEVEVLLSPVQDADSAYMTQSASVTSTPSSLSPVSLSPSDWPQQTQTRVQRKSWAAGQTEFHEHYQRHHLHQSESCHDIGQQDVVTAGEFVVPSNVEIGMVSVFSSARRRLGRRREPQANNLLNSKSNKNEGVETSSSGGELHRAPSSLFYLEYEGDQDNDDDDEESMKSRRKYSDDMSSSRKISAAAYLPRANTTTSTPTDDTQHQEHQEHQEHEGLEVDESTSNEQDDRTTTVARRRRRVERPHHLAVTTIDEILKRQDSSLDQYYKDTLRQIDSVTKVFRLNDDIYRQLMTVLNAEMDRGLQRASHHEATVKMFHTYVRALPTGTERGRYVALDLGGTNFRVLLVELTGRRAVRPDVVSKVYLIPLKMMLGTAQMLFDHIASCIAEFLNELGVKDQHFSLGFTFSFPCVQRSLSSATLVRWTKGFNCSGVEGEDVVELLRDAIRRRQDLSVDCVAIINDNVGVLMAGAHSDPNCRIGLILGTGTNCCYVEDLDKVELWTGDTDEPRQMVVNTEWGAFGDDGQMEFVRNEFDRQLDQQSLNPHHQLFEKMISGMYMGEIVRLILCELTMRGLLFNRQLSEQLFEPQRFYTKYISEIESDDPAAGDYPNTRLVLEELCITDVTVEDCRYIQHVCWQVSQRAAHLAATAAAVVIQRVGLNDVTVAVDGSLYRFHPHFKQLMTNKIAQLLPAHQQFKLTLAHDGSGQGAALVAATAAPTTDDDSAWSRDFRRVDYMM